MAGDEVTYTVRVRNVGKDSAEKLVLGEGLPEVFSFVAGSCRLNGEKFDDPGANGWNLPALSPDASHTLIFRAQVDKAEANQRYENKVDVSGVNAGTGQPIAADGSQYNPEDNNPTDTARTVVYGGPLTYKEAEFYLAYEDLKSAGWSDWDFNDFVVRMRVRNAWLDFGSRGDGRMIAGPPLVGATVAYEAMARGGAYDHAFVQGLQVKGGGVQSLAVFNAKGEEQLRTFDMFEAPPQWTIFDSTRRTLPAVASYPGSPFANTYRSQTTPEPGWTAQLSFVLFEPESNAGALWSSLPWDPYLYVKETKQEVHLDLPGQSGNTQVAKPSVYNYCPQNPLLGYNLPFVQLFDQRWRWPTEFNCIWSGYLGYSDYVISGGAKATEWYVAPTEPYYIWPVPTSEALRQAGAAAVSSRYYAQPLVTDLNQDGAAEIIVGNYALNRLEVYGPRGAVLAGWPQPVDGPIRASAVAANLDDDTALEILVGDETGMLYAFNLDGTAVEGWPVIVGSDPTQSFRILARPAVADIDGDAAPEVIVALADGRLYVFAADGTLRDGWPHSLGEVADAIGSQTLNSSPVVADIRGDARPEIIAGGYNGVIYAYNGDGSLAWSHPTAAAIVATPAIGDVDAAVDGVEVVVGSGDGFVYILDRDGVQLRRLATDWRVDSSPLLVNLDADPTLEIVVGTGQATGIDFANKVWAWNGDGTLLANWPKTTAGPVPSAPAAGDVTGDGQPEVVIAGSDTQVYVVMPDGSDAITWPRQAGSPVQGGPALANLDDDPAQEVIVATLDGRLLIFDLAARVYLPAVAR